MELEKNTRANDPRSLYQFFGHLNMRKSSADGKSISLSWSVRDGYPRAALKIGEVNNDNFKDNYVGYRFDYIRLRLALDYFKDMIEKRKETTLEVAVNYPSDKNGVTSNNIIGKLVFGYSSNEGPFILCTRDTTFGVKFTFNSNNSYTTFAVNGNVVDLREEMAIAYINLLRETIEHTLREQIVNYENKRENSMNRMNATDTANKSLNDAMGEVGMSAPATQTYTQPAPQQVEQSTQQHIDVSSSIVDNIY